LFKAFLRNRGPNFDSLPSACRSHAPRFFRCWDLQCRRPQTTLQVYPRSGAQGEVDAAVIAAGHHQPLVAMTMARAASVAAAVLAQVLHHLVHRHQVPRNTAQSQHQISLQTMAVLSGRPVAGPSMVALVQVQRLLTILRAVSLSLTWIWAVLMVVSTTMYMSLSPTTSDNTAILVALVAARNLISLRTMVTVLRQPLSIPTQTAGTKVEPRQ